MNTTPSLRRPVTVIALLATLVIAACSSAAAPAASQGSASPILAPPSSQPSPSDPDTSVGAPSDPGLVDPGAGQPALVIPRPGQLNPRPLGAATLEPAVNGRRVLVKVTWWSGVEPCNVLDSVKVDHTGTTFDITLIEGSSDANAICIELAQQKATIVDLGELEPGTYTITSSRGDAAPVTFTVE
jgi:ABC-type transport system substrate-binding protein